MIPQIKFSHNWNNKLLCISFTTIRPRCDEKYNIGQAYDIVYNDRILGTGIIQEITHFKLDQLNEFMAQVDTGYSKEAATHIIKTMYKARNYNYGLQQFSMILIRMPDTKTRYIIADQEKLINKAAPLHPEANLFYHQSQADMMAIA